MTNPGLVAGLSEVIEGELCRKVDECARHGRDGDAADIAASRGWICRVRRVVRPWTRRQVGVITSGKGG
jgi:hypothetical protein